MTTTEIKPTREHAVKILGLLDHGLTKGLGIQVPGKMCVEAAVCAAFDLPHSDKPPCVGYAVRHFKITLNDCEWPSDKDRADGMRKLAIAQLGSDTLDQMEFGKRICERMEKCETFEAARQLAKDASAYASAYAYAYAYRHELLKLTASIGVEVLVEMNSPGCKWLSLIKD